MYADSAPDTQTHVTSNSVSEHSDLWRTAALALEFLKTEYPELRALGLTAYPFEDAEFLGYYMPFTLVINLNPQSKLASLRVRLPLLMYSTKAVSLALISQTSEDLSVKDIITWTVFHEGGHAHDDWHNITNPEMFYTREEDYGEPEVYADKFAVALYEKYKGQHNGKI